MQLDKFLTSFMVTLAAMLLAGSNDTMKPHEAIAETHHAFADTFSATKSSPAPVAIPNVVQVAPLPEESPLIKPVVVEDRTEAPKPDVEEVAQASVETPVDPKLVDVDAPPVKAPEAPQVVKDTPKEQPKTEKAKASDQLVCDCMKRTGRCGCHPVSYQNEERCEICEDHERAKGRSRGCASCGGRSAGGEVARGFRGFWRSRDGGFRPLRRLFGRRRCG